MRALHPLLMLFIVACTPATGAVSPHGSSTGCNSCHVSMTGGNFIAGNDIATCYTCHEKEPHQVDIAPSRTRIPESWPLVEGRLSCMTCHDEPACDNKTVSPDNKRFFRGGPYQKIGELCANCHQATNTAQLNPHETMRHSTGDALTSSCLLCHETAPTAASTVRLPGAETCRGCHYSTMHAGMSEHMVTVPAEMATRAQAAGLPLTAEGQASCLTCHDPHPAGITQASTTKTDWNSSVAVPESWQKAVLAPAQAQRGGAEVHSITTSSDMLRLTVTGGELCSACHGSGPERKKP